MCSLANVGTICILKMIGARVRLRLFNQREICMQRNSVVSQALKKKQRHKQMLRILTIKLNYCRQMFSHVVVVVGFLFCSLLDASFIRLFYRNA